MIRQFDGSAATFKKIPPLPTVPILEERQEIPNFGSDGKAKAAVFDSEALRFEKERQRSPGPCQYDPTEPVYIL